MSSYLSLQSYAPASVEYVLVDGSGSYTWVLMDESDWGNAVWEHTFSGPRGTQGSRPAGGIPTNREVTLALKYLGSSQDDAAARMSELHSVVDEMRRYGGRVTRRAHGQTYRQHFDVLVANHRLAEWGRAAELTNIYRPLASFTCAPYVMGDSMGFLDEFETDGVNTDYEVVEGTGTLTVTDGWLDTEVATTVRALESKRGYRYGDVYMRAELRADAAYYNTDQSYGLILRYVDAENFIEACMENYSSGSRATRIRVVLAGVERVVTTARTAGLNGIKDVLVAWIDGNKIVVQHHPVARGDSPYSSLTSLSASQGSTFLTAAEAAVLGAKVATRVGFKIDRHSASVANTGFATFGSLEVKPYFYTGYTWPVLGALDLQGEIPGDVPALAEVSVTIPASGLSDPPRFALIGWAPTPSPWNMVWNGDFESSDVSADGWSVAAVAGVTAAATSAVRAFGTAQLGVAEFSISHTATADSGVNFPIRHRFRQGFTYRARAYARQTSAAGIELCLGVSGDLAVSSILTNTGGNTMQEVTVDWTPAADTSVAYLAIRGAGTTAAATLLVDGVSVVAGTDEPVAITQRDGGGGHPPLYALPANAVQEAVTFTTLTTDTTALGGQRRENTAIGAAGNGALSWIVDPSLIAPDDYTQGELDVEVWVRAQLDDDLVGLRLLAWANPTGVAYNSDLLGQRRYTRRHGSRGKPVTVPSTTDAYRIIRAGVIPMTVNRNDPTMWRVTVQFTYQAGSANSIGIDYALLVPARSRILSPTGEDRSLGGYPDFISGTGTEITKTIRPDLSAVIGQAAYRSRFPDHGLGGSSLLEVPAGLLSVNMILSDEVPDDPKVTDNDAMGLPPASLQITPTPRWAILRDVESS